jgi:hypothetical protein
MRVQLSHDFIAQPILDRSERRRKENNLAPIRTQTLNPRQSNPLGPYTGWFVPVPFKICKVTVSMYVLAIRPYGSVTLSRGTFYPQKLALTSSTSVGHSIGIVRSRSENMEFSFMCVLAKDLHSALGQNKDELI